MNLVLMDFLFIAAVAITLIGIGMMIYEHKRPYAFRTWITEIGVLLFAAGGAVAVVVFVFHYLLREM
jgi:hypothetical protein